MFSQTAEYALRTMVWLASRHPAAQTTRQIADATRVPVGYLSKILQTLGRAGLVNSRRGINGGFTLAADPREITPLDVLEVVDPIRRIERCPLGISSHATELCPLHRRLDEAIAHIAAALAGTNLTELVTESGRAAPLCDGRVES